MKPTIADVLHLAADKFLSQDDFTLDSSMYSCIAIKMVLLRMELIDMWPAIADGLLNLGLPDFDVQCFTDIESGNRQEVRYAWLKFCALLAEEQGV